MRCAGILAYDVQRVNNNNKNNGKINFHNKIQRYYTTLKNQQNRSLLFTIYYTVYILNKNINLFIYNCINNDECLLKSCNNNVMQQRNYASDDLNLNERHIDHHLSNTLFSARNHP